MSQETVSTNTPANINEVVNEIEKTKPEYAGIIRKYMKSHAYGLVFERNLPEGVRLWSKAPETGDTVNILPPRGTVFVSNKKVCLDNEDSLKPWIVEKIMTDEAGNKTATLVNGDEEKSVPYEDIVTVIGYKNVIYPGLKVIDKVERGNPDDPYHMIINAENYHALEALAYAYAGKVDCIYIDPPYNTGAKDWKYNNDYVGQDDQYRHSKWLAFMERRLKLAKQLLNPEDSVMIVTIDEKEYLRLGILLEQMFPEARIQMISSIINTAGSSRGREFARCNEYLYIVLLGKASPKAYNISGNDCNGRNGVSGKNSIWKQLRKTSDAAKRSDRPNLFYPIYIDPSSKIIKKIGDSIDISVKIDDIPDIDGLQKILPIRSDGSEGRWYCEANTLRKYNDAHYVKVGTTGNISYLTEKYRKGIEAGEYTVTGYRDGIGEVLFEDNNNTVALPGNQWNYKSHDAGSYGTGINKELMPDRKFPYPKSLYAVEDVLRFFVADKPDALIVDFFAGSGTTAHATMLLNHLDGGHRRSISITNNEIGNQDEIEFTKKGLRPCDPEWKRFGIANYITWPRIKAAITGINTLGEPIQGDYKFTEEFPMSDGFQQNAVFCELTYEAEWPIRLDRAFDAIAPILWMQAGCKGPIIRKIGKCFLTTSQYGVLFDFNQLSKFCEQVKKKNLKTVFVVTDDQRRYSSTCRRLPGVTVHRLYETYLRTFEIWGEGALDA